MAESELELSPLAEALARVGDRWTLLVVEALLPGPRRFNELLSLIPGIAANILSERLKRLERDGLLVCPALLPAPAPGRLPADRRGRGTRRGAPAARALGDPAHRPGGRPAPPHLRHPDRGPLVLPDLRPARRPRAAQRPDALRVTEQRPAAPDNQRNAPGGRRGDNRACHPGAQRDTVEPEAPGKPHLQARPAGYCPHRVAAFHLSQRDRVPGSGLLPSVHPGIWRRSKRRRLWSHRPALWARPVS